MVVRHLEAGSAETALDVKAFVGLAAVENGLVAADVGGDVVEGLDDAQAELLALLVLGDGNVFDVASFSESVNAARKKKISNGSVYKGKVIEDVQFALDYQRPRGDDRLLRPGSVFDDENVVPLLGRHCVVLLLKVFLCNVAHRRQHPQAVEEAAAVVGPSQGSHSVARGQRGGDLWRDEAVREEAGFSHCVVG